MGHRASCTGHSPFQPICRDSRSEFARRTCEGGRDPEADLSVADTMHGRARGVSEWQTVVKHAFRNTLIPVVTASGIILSLLIGGSVIVEQVFALPGIGRLIVQAILARDYPLVQGTMLLLGFAFVVINLLLDVVYTLVDPRIRYE